MPEQPVKDWVQELVQILARLRARRVSFVERVERTVLLADNGSGQVQAIDVGSLP